MANSRDRILLVEADPVISDFIGRQALQAAGFQVMHSSNASEAIAKVSQVNPELIIANISLPGLSGKDFLVALSSQNVRTPVVVLAQKGQEAAVIQTLRLGAADYLLWPLREGEIISAVERLLKQSHERRERDQLARQLQQANQELQLRVRELTTIFSIGKAVTTVIEQHALFEKILDGALSVSQADMGWFVLRDDATRNLSMVAQRNLPASFVSLNQPLDEGISSLVTMSGEPLSIYGEPLRRFRLASLGQSALITPIKVQKQVIGLLVVMRKQAQAFSTSEQHLLEAVADYASISLVNARLFRAVEERAHSLQTLADNTQTAQKIDRDLLNTVKKELSGPQEQTRILLDRLSKDPSWWSSDQKQILAQMSDQINQISQVTAAFATPDASAPASDLLNDLLRQSVKRLSPYALQNNLNLAVDIPPENMPLPGRAEAVAQVLDALLSNAIKFSRAGGTVHIRLEKTRAQEAHLVITDAGPGMDPRLSARIFERSTTSLGTARNRPFGGIGISLWLAQEIVNGLRGKIWVESKPERGSSFHLALPLRK